MCDVYQCWRNLIVTQGDQYRSRVTSTLHIRVVLCLKKKMQAVQKKLCLKKYISRSVVFCLLESKRWSP